MVQSYAVLQVADGVLHLGVSAVVGFQLGAGRGLHPADDEAHWCGVGLTVEGSVNGLGHGSAAPSIQ